MDSVDKCKLLQQLGVSKITSSKHGVLKHDKYSNQTQDVDNFKVRFAAKPCAIYHLSLLENDAHLGKADEHVASNIPKITYTCIGKIEKMFAFLADGNGSKESKK